MSYTKENRMISYLFPGQGSQTKGMGETLFDEFPEMTEKADNLLGYSIKDLCLNNESKQLNQTQYTQPAIYIVNALSYLRKIKQTGKIPSFVAGHSLGEYNALQAAGAMSFEDGLKLVKKRGELMAQVGQGAMAAVLRMSKDDIQYCLDCNDLSMIDIANYNGPTQIVISGLPEDLNRAQAFIEQAGADFIPLNTSGSFHSRYMEPVKTEFAIYLEQFEFADLQIPVISNIHARPYQTNRIKVDLANQITHSVKWQQSMHYLLEQGVDEFEEIGNGNVLTKLMVPIKSYFSANRNNQQADQTNTTLEQTIPTLEMLHKQIDNWNKRYAIGTTVKVAEGKEGLQTRTEAMIILNHKAVIYMQGYKGYFALNKVSAMP